MIEPFDESSNELSTVRIKKLLSQGGEALTNGHTGSELENFDIDGNGQVAIQQVDE